MVKASTYNVGGEGNGNPLQYFCLEYPTVRGTWGAEVHGVKDSDTTEATYHRAHNAKDPGLIPASPLEKEMGNHSSTLAWKIPWTEEPSGPK